MESGPSSAPPPLSALRPSFPAWNERTWEKLAALEVEFRSWNDRLNLVSRKDMERWQVHHLQHSLALTRVLVDPPPHTRILDVGTGGGLPGLPLAIVYPQVKVFLCDSIEKKANALRAMIEALELHNVEVVHKRAETLESRWDYVLGRAVTELPRFLSWITKNIKPGGPAECPHGVLYFKGTRYREEIASIALEPWRVHALDTIYPATDYFAEKFLLHFDAQTLQACPALRPPPPAPRKTAKKGGRRNKPRRR